VIFHWAAAAAAAAAATLQAAGVTRLSAQSTLSVIFLYYYP
jgi:hypothetical protein